MVSVTVLKIILAIVMMALTAAFGLLPMPVLGHLRKRAARRGSGETESLSDWGGSRWPGLVLCLLSCFSGGVFLGTCFLHLYPEMNGHLAEMVAQFHWDLEYPVAELIAIGGFFLIYAVEELVVARCHGHSHVTLVTTSAEPSYGTSHSSETSEPQPNGRSTAAKAKVPRATWTSSSGEPTSSVEVAEPERCEGPCVGVEEDPPILMGSAPHQHSHALRSLSLVLALSFHSVIEGIAFGISETASDVTSLFVSLIIHKVVVGFSVGLQLARTHAHNLRLVLASVLLLAAMSPLGIAIGILVEETTAESVGKEVTLLIFEGLAVGTFLYVVFFEILIHERDNMHNNGLKLVAMMAGFGAIALLRLLEHEHGHGGGGHNATLDATTAATDTTMVADRPSRTRPWSLTDSLTVL